MTERPKKTRRTRKTVEKDQEPAAPRKKRPSPEGRKPSARSDAGEPVHPPADAGDLAHPPADSGTHAPSPAQDAVTPVVHTRSFVTLRRPFAVRPRTIYKLVQSPPVGARIRAMLPQAKEPPPMDLLSLLALLRRRIWYVAAPLAISLTASTIASLFMTPTYRATTTLIVAAADSSVLNYDTLLFNRNLAKTYVEVARSRAVAQQAILRLNLNEDSDHLLGRISVTTVRETELISIAVTDTSPVRAATLANTVAAVFAEEIQRFARLNNLRVVDQAAVPAEPLHPRPLLYTAVSLFVGLAAGTALAYVVDYFKKE